MESSVLLYPAAAAPAVKWVEDELETAHLGDGIVGFAPGAYFFRRDLREAMTRQQALDVCMVLLGELLQLRGWSIACGLPEPIPENQPSFGHRLLRAADIEAVRAIGLEMVAQIERIRGDAAHTGIIAPKWVVAPREAAEKHWAH